MEKPRITMSEVAEIAQVSKMSVSRVLNNKPGVSEETRKRVLDALDELGYKPNIFTRVYNSPSKLIGLLIPDITSAYIGEILRGVSSAAEKLNQGLLLYTQGRTQPDERTHYYFSLLNTGLVDGVLMIVPRNYETIVQDLKKRELPYVIIDHHSNVEDEPSVTATNRKGMLEATRYLVALAHRRIGFITGRKDIACSYERLQGYKDALAEVGIPFEPELVRDGDNQQRTGFHEARNLLQLKNPPTAIIASNDLMAFGVMDAARTAGLMIGRDISIIGFDDIYMASQSYPPLTTVRQPLAEMGEVALDTLLMLLEERKVLNLQRELPTELIVRESTGHAP